MSIYRLRRTALIAGLGCLSLGISLAANTEKATYLGGSVNEIPRFKETKLDLGDAAGLGLRWEESAYTIEWNQITTMELGRSGRRASRVKNVPVWMKRDGPAITIRFRKAQGPEDVVILALSNADVRTAVTVLESRTGKEVTGAAKTDETGWWGDRVWRTPRNEHTWPRPGESPTAKSDAPPAASATTSRE